MSARNSRRTIEAECNVGKKLKEDKSSEVANQSTVEPNGEETSPYQSMLAQIASIASTGG